MRTPAKIPCFNRTRLGLARTVRPLAVTSAGKARLVPASRSAASLPLEGVAHA